MIETIKNIVSAMIAAIAKTGIGTVYDYDPNTYSVRVELQPLGQITGWMPLGTLWVGNGFGMVIGPGIGDLVRVDFIDGHAQAQLAGARFYSAQTPPPVVPSGEMLVQHASGSLIHFDNSGNVTLTANQAMTINAPTGMTINANTQLNGNVQASGSISDLNAAHGTLDAFRTAYNTATYPDPQGGNTGTTSNPV